MGPSRETFPPLLDLLYGCLAGPNRWDDFLSELRRLVRGESAELALHDPANRKPVALSYVGLPTGVVQEWNDHYGRINPRTPRLIGAALRSGFYLANISLCDAPAAWQDNEYAHWLGRHDLHHGVVAFVSIGNKGFASLSLIRPQSAGAFGPEAAMLVRRLLPHFQRAFQVSRELEALRATAEAGKAALDQLDAGLVAVDGEGRVVFMSQRAEDIVKKQRGLLLSRGRLAATNSLESNRLEGLVLSAAMTGAGRGAGSGGAMTIQADEAARLSITVTPFRSTHPLTGEQPCALIFISDPKAKPTSRAALLRNLFGLTPTEGRLAEMLLEGVDVRVASERLRVTAATARFMLKNIFHKTACHRQGQFMRLLSTLPGERQPSDPGRT